MQKKNSPLLTDEERALFREQMKNVTPLSKKKQTQVTFPKSSILKVRTLPTIRPPQIEEICPLDISPSANVSPSESIKFFRPGLQFRQIQRLQRGEFKPESILDLHGLTVMQAHETLYEFLQNSIRAKQRCVCVIHGKGGQMEIPILKNKVNQWLRSYSSVLGFCSARPKDGGTGAVYVLLKSFRVG